MSASDDHISKQATSVVTDCKEKILVLVMKISKQFKKEHFFIPNIFQENCFSSFCRSILIKHILSNSVFLKL